jgi:DNA-binding transcriptional ArsR family regulator
MPADRSSQKGQPRSRSAGPPERQVEAADDEALRLLDPRDIRAIAHPARMAVIDALASGDELTATECAELTGLIPSATAYHLKFLERHDFAEPAPARKDGREKPWRATDRRTLVDLDTSTPAGAAAATAVGPALIDRSRALAKAFLTTEHEEPEEWQNVASLATADVWLTADEIRTVTAGRAAVLEPYRDRALADRRDRTRRARTMNMVFPHSQH